MSKKNKYGINIPEETLFKAEQLKGFFGTRADSFRFMAINQPLVINEETVKHGRKKIKNIDVRYTFEL